jgi:FtsH-binding integral membrane protein
MATMIVPQRAASRPNMVVLGRTQARLVWFAIAALFVAAVVGSLVAASSIPAAPDPALGEIFLAVASVVVVVDIAVGFFITSRIRKNAPASAPPDGIAATQVIIGAATSLSGGLVSAVFFFITHQGLILLLAAPSALVLLLWFPSERRWAALRPAQAPGEPRRNPMVR